MKIAFYTLGCKLNYAETSTLQRVAVENGHDVVPFSNSADVYVINTCTVTAIADKKCRNIIRKAYKQNENAKIIVTGCYAQTNSDEISKIYGVSLIIGNNEKNKFDGYLKNISKAFSNRHAELVSASPNKEMAGQARYDENTSSERNVDHNNIGIISASYFAPNEGIQKQVRNDEANEQILKQSRLLSGQNDVKDVFFPAYSIGDRTRSFLKVQDGCNYFCAYCAIPNARGRSRNASIIEIVEQANEIASKGIKEIVLTGINIGDFGHSTNETFFDLIKELDNIEGIERFRISSIEPDLLEPEIIDFVKLSKHFVPHFHIPLQSGSQTILKLMKRKYDITLFSDRINYLLKTIPDVCIGLDVIVGFPGENESEFNETCNLLNSIDVAYFHVFTYSERENTISAKLPNKVSFAEKEKRSGILHKLSEEKKETFYRKFIGNELNVLFESKTKDGKMHGFTDNYIKVEVPSVKALYNKIERVKLLEFDKEKMVVISKLI
ncbi:MAG: tRNA (N(6)-L-threonylcarbamoyladenosine(37)-C(2))-methylthiotransferase MtaB [Bacteroidetes bacterium GWA2_32_17]|nr:MAG: tRNA (N(6)-L-threonylcarbamoyladenosine(37)-C(2))-methylthiotransferase MtaB [Bacteroidetes bacterium GWA2_32_17]